MQKVSNSSINNKFNVGIFILRTVILFFAAFLFFQIHTYLNPLNYVINAINFHVVIADSSSESEIIHLEDISKLSTTVENQIDKSFTRTLSHFNTSITLFSMALAIFVIIVGFISINRIKEAENLLTFSEWYCSPIGTFAFFIWHRHIAVKPSTFKPLSMWCDNSRTCEPSPISVLARDLQDQQLSEPPRQGAVRAFGGLPHMA